MNDKINASRFLGFAGLYENVRPSVPAAACGILVDYFGKKPSTTVDLGCGTGLSTIVWKDKSERIIGIEPSDDMLATARHKEAENISFIQAFSDHTTLPEDTADIVVCSQSFHWMEPQSTLAEVNRILKPGGVFATIDCDWPPVCDWRAESAYCELMSKVHHIESEHARIRESFRRWDKNEHKKQRLFSLLPGNRLFKPRKGRCQQVHWPCAQPRRITNHLKDTAQPDRSRHRVI